ncbi:hypothetical protein Ahy_A01g004521 isoform A [Arachis hypogaea]|uniref:Uncharacterized protein n=1 Tax=Arachis hypogaea TaxID=3818 RepID=A0A445EWB0_ARAHY|nr:hypothetical protein Ahy_A01g004521 isoform A [Arachis hypogaea]
MLVMGSEEEDDIDDPDYEDDSDLHFSDSENDYCGNDGLFDVDITLGEMHQDIRKSKKSKSAIEKLKKTQKVAIGKGKSFRLSDDEGLNSDELEEVSSEDDEFSKKNFSTLYATREKFKEAVTSYAVHTRRNIKFSMVDNVRVRTKCGDGCEWFAYAVKMANENGVNGIRPKYWTKSRFEFYPKCDALVNNMCESFNSAIVE